MRLSRYLTTAMAALLLMHGASSAQTPSAPAAAPATAPATAPQGMTALFVLNAQSAKIDGKTLSLEGVSRQTIMFADRPVRRAGHMKTASFLHLWSEGGTFGKSAPNATISAFAKDGTRIADAVVELKSPRQEGDRVVFHVAVLQGSIDGIDGPASLFIDTVWFGFGGGDGFHYLGQNDTSGGTSPSISNGRDGYSTGWPNPSPDGRSTPPPSYNPPPLSAPPGYR